MTGDELMRAETARSRRTASPSPAIRPMLMAARAAIQDQGAPMPLWFDMAPGQR